QSSSDVQSYRQSRSQPSPAVRLPSSHCSPPVASTSPSPHMLTTHVPPRQMDSEPQRVPSAAEAHEGLPASIVPSAGPPSAGPPSAGPLSAPTAEPASIESPCVPPSSAPSEEGPPQAQSTSTDPTSELPRRVLRARECP